MRTVLMVVLGAGLLLWGCGDSELTSEHCGNGSIDPGEFCDGNELGGKTCGDLGYTGGELGCDSDCIFDASNCTSSEDCGNGMLDEGEVCDGIDLGGASCQGLGYVGGELACSPACRLDHSGCSSCGDGVLDPGEECDGDELGGKSCTDLGYHGGELSCGADCTFNTGACVGPPSCGNHLVEDGEQCDGIDLDDSNCTDFGHVGGELACHEDCSFNFDFCHDCGNQEVDTGEDCDGDNLDDQVCADLGYFSGELSCTGDCRFDTGACVEIPVCNNGVLEVTEECDGEALGGESCESLGFVGGSLGCAQDCTFDISQCFACGNGVIEVGEECDGEELGGADCTTAGFYTGTLGCTEDCEFDVSQCTNCGNGVVDSGEDCDGTDMGGGDCEALGWIGGELLCTAGCEYDESLCNNCEPPDPVQPWLTEYHQDILSRLTGEAEIAPGVTISQRYTAYQRQMTREFLISKWDELGLETFLHEYDSNGANPYAILPATVETDEWVIVGAHMDSTSTSPGADDNGSGTTQVVSMSRYASMIPCRARNLLFMGFDQEEVGLIGSYDFAEWLSNEGWNVHSVHTFDMVGIDDNQNRRVNLARASQMILDIYYAAKAAGSLTMPIGEVSYSSSDHMAFLNYGFDTVMVAEEWGTDAGNIHSPYDVYEDISFGYMESTAVLMNYVLLELTRLPDK